MRRSSSLRSSATPRPRPPHTRGLPGKLATLFSPEEWALFPEVRNTTGMSDLVRYADLIGVYLLSPEQGLRIHGFEFKASRRDFLKEISQPEKSGPLVTFCSAFWLVVRAPWKHTVLSTALELPQAWGLIEIGTGPARIIEPALERKAEQPPTGFVLSLLRASVNNASANDQDALIGRTA